MLVMKNYIYKYGCIINLIEDKKRKYQFLRTLIYQDSESEDSSSSSEEEEDSLT